MIDRTPKTILCIHDLSCLGRAGLSAVVPVLSVSGLQPVCLPTAVLSSHTGGLGAPAVMQSPRYGAAALEQYRQLGLSFDCIYSGYLAGPEQAWLVEKAHEYWPEAFLLVDPVLGDGGRMYSGLPETMVSTMRRLCALADLIVPNITEAALLMGQSIEPPADREGALALAHAVQASTGAKATVVTGIDIGRYIFCAGAERDDFVVRRLRIDRSYPGTGDLFAAVLLSRLHTGNALSAAVDAAAAFVADCITATPADADPRFGVWFEPRLWQLAAR